MKKLPLALVALALLSAAALARADDNALAATARKAAQAYDQAIVNIDVVTKISVHSTLPINLGNAQEQKVATVGTVIDTSGLVVTSLTALDPVRAIPSMKMNVPGAGEGTINFSSELHDLKYRLADGTEIAGRIVLQDADLDLAFIAPEKPLDAAVQAKVVALPLTDPAPAAEVVERTIMLGRTGKNLNYTPTLELGRITACISKPRRYYLGGSNFGTPVFNAQGQVLGLFVNKPDHETKTVNPMMGGGKPALLPIILPIAEVSAGAVQARVEAAKPAVAPAPATAPAATGNAAP